MTTYLLITSDKPTELTAFVGPKKRMPNINDYDEDCGYAYDCRRSEERYNEAMETAKASRLPVVNFEKLIGHTSSSGSVYIYDRLEELKPGEVVPLPGWELEKVYQKQYEDRWIITSKYNYGLGKTTDYPESFRQAYRLKRSEQVKELPEECQDPLASIGGCVFGGSSKNYCKKCVNESPIEANRFSPAQIATIETNPEIYRDKIEDCPKCFGSGETQPNYNCKACEGTGIKHFQDLINPFEIKAPIEAKTQVFSHEEVKSMLRSMTLSEIRELEKKAHLIIDSHSDKELDEMTEHYFVAMGIKYAQVESHKTQESQIELWNEYFSDLKIVSHSSDLLMQHLTKKWILTRRNP